MARWSGLRGVLVACAVVAGLLAMHGLTQHGDHFSATGTAPHADRATHDPAAVAVALTRVVPRLDLESADDLAGSGALAMCFIVLAAACLTVWATVRPRGGVLRTLTPAVTPPPHPPTRARAPDPPGRWTLSVCRC